MKRLLRTMLAAALALLCAAAMAETKEDMTMLAMKIDETPVRVEWEDNASAQALAALAQDAPLKISMSMYGGFEQVGPIGHSLPREDRQTVTQAGDIVLYSGDQLVVFYGSNSWAYTPLGRIVDPAPDALAALLGSGDVTVTLGGEN